MALAVAPRIEVHKCAQILANARQPSWTRNSNTRSCEPQSHHADWLDQSETREACDAIQIGKRHRSLPTACINPQLNRQSLSDAAQGALARPKFMRQRNQMHGVQRVLLRLSHPQPVAHGRPSTSIQFAAAAGKPCGVDTGHFRTGEPSNR